MTEKKTPNVLHVTVLIWVELLTKKSTLTLEKIKIFVMEVYLLTNTRTLQLVILFRT